MEISNIQARDLSEAWFLCLREILTKGRDYTIERGSYAGQTRKELDFIVVQIKKPGTRPLVPDVPQGVPPPSTMEYVESYLPYLMASHKKEGEQYTYGQYLERQISEVIKMYQKDGYNTNQAYMAVGDAESIDWNDPPCLRGIDTRIQHGSLHFFVYFRSWDLWAGFPSNLAAIQLLKEYMASEIGVRDGELIAMSKGLHLYRYSWEQARSGARMERLRTGQLPLELDWGGKSN
ncbi:MAG: thymidylate synthase [Chloroflexi bacterium RBG_16_56_11]|nr:MAG: thymidylate synthase [Chloroflexi bacterium RBG_16_56_11]